MTEGEGVDLGVDGATWGDGARLTSQIAAVSQETREREETSARRSVKREEKLVEDRRETRRREKRGFASTSMAEWPGSACRSGCGGSEEEV